MRLMSTFTKIKIRNKEKGMTAKKICDLNLNVVPRAYIIWIDLYKFSTIYLKKHSKDRIEAEYERI